MSKHTEGLWGLEGCAKYLPTRGGCEAVPGVFCEQLHVNDGWEGGAGWLNACVVDGSL